MFKELNENLVTTVEALGFPIETWAHSPPLILAAAPPEKLAMGRAYQQVNDDLYALLDRGPVRLQHVTGEARALIDPAHRRILRRAAAEGQPGELGCHFGWENKPTALEFFRRQREYWGPASWVDLMDVLSLLAQGMVDLFVLAEPQDIHFSLFGQRHVLLQDKHHHPTEKKWVWFIECPALVEHLRSRVELLFAKASRISANNFDSFLSALYSYETVEVARRLIKPETLPIATCPFDRNQQQVSVEQLSAMGFAKGQLVANEQSACQLTNFGVRWLKEILNEDC